MKKSLSCKFKKLWGAAGGLLNIGAAGHDIVSHILITKCSPQRKVLLFTQIMSLYAMILWN